MKRINAYCLAVHKQIFQIKTITHARACVRARAAPTRTHNQFIWEIETTTQLVTIVLLKNQIPPHIIILFQTIFFKTHNTSLLFYDKFLKQTKPNEI